MNASELPRNHKGQYSWKPWLDTSKIGDSLEIRCEDLHQAKRLRMSASNCARDLGFYLKTHIAGLTVTVTRAVRELYCK